MKELRFRWSWRPYQERVLRAIEEHLRDRKLHVVAAPGAGKTTLGIEIFRMLGKPAVVLSPTVTIRDQWVSRLRDFGAPGPDWASTDLGEDACFRSLTYQALHTRYREGDEGASERAPSRAALDRVVGRMRDAGVGTIILDEAHHLRQEWWKALSHLVEGLPGAVLVSLTATPPYDVVGSQWQRYEELCGSIDEEISVPELVRAGTLCPHQDYVWAVAPREEDVVTVREYDRRVRQLFLDLLKDDALLAIVRAHPWVASPEPDPAEVLERPEQAFALLGYLRARGDDLPEPLLRLLGVEAMELPPLERRWWQVLVEELLHRRRWVPKEYRDALARRLRKDDLLWRRELRLEASRPVERKLALTPAKVGACVEVNRLERELRGEALRQVVLTDFIRDKDENDARLGAWPVFRALAAEDVALLTGRLSIVHETRLEALGDVEARPLETMPGFVRVSGRLVRPFTRLLAAGHVRVLVGTRALLGEGWDAPSVNSLVLASYVGSFMLTNQMRGRAIRIDKERPEKAASIWHLVAFDPESESGRSDLEALGRRFDTFVGLAADEPVIRSGLARMALPVLRNLAVSNDMMARRLAGHGRLAARWKEALDGGELRRVVPGVEAKDPPKCRRFWFGRTLRYLLYCAVQGFLLGFAAVGESVERIRFRSLGALLWVLAIACGVGLLFSLPKLFRALWILLRHLPVDGAVREIATALRDALVEAELIETPKKRLGLSVQAQQDGSVLVSLTGATFLEQSRFADAMGEILLPIANPRYLLVRGGGRRKDYHAVPRVLATKRELAELLHARWAKRVGPAELVYTRNPEGRATLLRARARAFSAAFARKSERHDRWM